MNLHHAPWSRWFKTFYCRGQYAHELQIGPLVFQWFYEPFNPPSRSQFGPRYADRGRFNHRLHAWKDRYWNR